MIIDCETHVFPRNYDFRRCHVEHLLADMDRGGVDRTLLMFYSDSTLTSPCGEITDPGIKRFGESDEEVWGYFLESWQEHRDRFYFFNSDYKTVVDYYRELPFCNDEEREYLLGRAAHEFVTGIS